MILLLVCGVLFVALGAASFPVFPDLLRWMIKKQSIIKPATQTFDNWKSPPVPSYMNMMIFTYTNPDGIVKGEKPIVKEMGPYSYREIRENTILSMDADNITYLQNYSYVFDPEHSCAGCLETDNVTTPNIGLLATINMTQTLDNFQKFTLIAWMKANPQIMDLFLNVTVHDLLWGYTNPFLEQLVKELGPFLPEKVNPVLALKYNGTTGANLTGNMTINTGIQDVNKVQVINQWRGRSTSPYWLSDYADMINGTDGTHFRPYMDPHGEDRRLYMFVTDIARSLYVEFKDKQVVQGIHLNRYATTEFLFADNNTNPDNNAFCVPQCYESGLLYIGHTQDGNPPVFVSSPHFYLGEPGLWKNISGLHPEESKHGTFLSVEPYTGILMDGHKRLQINVLAETIPDIAIVENLQNGRIFLPVIYIHETATIDKPNADLFKNMVYLGRDLLHYTKFALCGLGGLLIITALIIGIVRQREMSNSFSKFENEDQTASTKSMAQKC